MGWRTMLAKQNERARATRAWRDNEVLLTAIQRHDQYLAEFQRAVREGEDEWYVLDCEYTLVLAHLEIKWQQERIACGYPQFQAMPKSYRDYIPDRLRGRTPIWMGHFMDRPIRA